MLTAVGCRGNFAPASLLTGLRVLAVRANPPEVPPGQTSTLDALVSDTAPDDGGTITYDWRVCNDAPIIGMGNVNPTCVTSLDAGVLMPVSSAATAMVTMPNVAPTALGLPDDSDGFYLPVILRVALGPEEVIAAYRLRYGIGHGVAPNQNPMLSTIEEVDPKLDDTPDAGAGLATTTVVGPGDMPTITVSRGATLRASFAAGSAETYPILTGVNQVSMTTEILTASWYSTQGHFSNPVTGVPKPLTKWEFNKFTSTTIPPSGMVIPLYIVARDERGGTDFTVRNFLLLP